MSKKILGVVTTLVIVAAVLVGVNAQAQTVSCANIDAMLSALGVTDAAKVAQAKVAFGCGAASTVSFTKDLTVGSTGAEVTALQTKLGVTPATGYFGAITKAAVMAYQTSKGISATGFVGPLTRAALNAAVVVVPTTPATPSTPVVTTGNEGDIKALTVLASPSNEDIAEGETVKVFGFEVEATDDSDLAMKRVDVVFDQAATNSNSPWKAFTSARLLKGSTEVASVEDLDSKSTWTEVSSSDKTYRVRFTGIDAVVKAGTKVKFYVEVTAKDSIDEADFTSANDFAINIPADGIRVVDGAGLDIYSGTASAAKNVDVTDLQAADVTITEGTDNPDTRTVVVDADNETTDETLLTMEIESADDSIVLNTLRVYATSTDQNVYDLVSDLRLEIDGQEYSGTIGNTADMTTYYDFDIDGDVTISADDTMKAKVVADFNKNATGTITVSFPGNTTAFDAESETTGDAVTSVSGVAEGETVTLALVGVDVSLAKKTLAVTTGDNNADDYVTGTFEVKITNNSKEILYVPLTANASTTASTTAGIDFAATIGGAVTATSTASVVVDQLTTLTEDTNSVKIQKGQSATIEVIVTYKPTLSTLSTYKLQLNNVHFSETAGAYDQTYTAPDTSSYRTSTVTIVN